MRLLKQYRNEGAITMMHFFRIPVSAILIFLLCSETVHAGVLPNNGDNSVSTGKVNAECVTDACRKEATSILEYMNENVRPCDDFYQFACGKFIESQSIPEEISSLSQFYLIEKELNKVLLDDIKTPIAPNEIKAIQNAKKHYQNCMDEPRIEQEGTRPILDFLDTLGGWPVLKGNDWSENNYQWMDTVLKIYQAGLESSFPVYLYIYSDSLDSTKNMVKINGPDLSVSGAYLGDSGVQYREALQTFMVNVAEMLGANHDTAVKDMKDCVDFEVELYNIKMSRQERLRISPVDSRKTLKQLSDSDEDISWTILVNKILNPAGITVGETEPVEIKDTRYVSGLGKLIKRTSARVLANYQIWQKVKDLIDYLPKTFEEKKLDLRRVTQGISKVEKRETVCISKVMGSFPVAVSAMYVRNHFNRQVKDNVNAIVQNIKNQIKDNFQNIDWMDDETRNYAIEKIDAMSAVVAYPDELLDDGKVDEYYADLEIESGNYMNGYIKIAKFLRNAMYKQLRASKHWTDEANVVEANASYMRLKNKFFLAAGILRDVFYQYDRPEYLNYGAAGFVIGHEMLHGFDDNGSKFDKNGNFKNWWQQATADKMKEKSQCMENQYSEYNVAQIGLNVNGIATRGENIADNGGIKFAYKAYQKWVTDNNVVEKRLPGLNYTPRQMFWIGAARVWCSKSKNEWLRAVVSTEHPPDVARVVIPFANNEDFSKDFSCEAGSKMNPLRKCQVW